MVIIYVASLLDHVLFFQQLILLPKPNTLYRVTIKPRFVLSPGWQSTAANSNFTYMATLLGYPTMMEAVTLNRSLNSASPKQRVGSPSTVAKLCAEIISTVDGLNNLKSIGLNNFNANMLYLIIQTPT